MAKGPKRITLKDISRRAGVSIGTASRVLNGSGGGAAISASTRRKVLEVASRLGYRVDISARAVKKGRFGALLLLQDVDISRTFESTSCLAGACARAEAHDLHIIFARIPDEELSSDRPAPKVFRELLADGVILNYHGRVPEVLMRRVEALQLPWVLINNKRAYDCVYPDELEAARRATERLIRLGHRRIAYLDYCYHKRDRHLYHFSRLERLAGYRAAMAESGLKPLFISGDGASPLRDKVSVLDFMRSLLKAPKRPTAFVGNSGIDELLHVAVELGLEVGRDLSAITFDESPRVVGWTVSAMLVPWRQMGEEAVEMLVEKIARPGRSHPPKVLQLTFREGETCGPPREKL